MDGRGALESIRLAPGPANALSEAPRRSQGQHPRQGIDPHRLPSVSPSILAQAYRPSRSNPFQKMTIAIPFDRSSRTRNPSILLDDDLLDAIDRARVAEDGQEPLSRSAMIRTMLYFALALMTDEKAQAEFALEHAHLIPQIEGTRLRRRA